MHVCVFCAPSQSGEVWNRVSQLLATQPRAWFPHIPLFGTSPSVSPAQPAPPTPHSDLAIARFTLLHPPTTASPLPPCLLYYLLTPLHHHSVLCLSSSPFSRGQFCVINSPVALLAHQLCHPYGQIKNWFLRLIPCTGWMRSSSSFTLTPSLALHPGQLHIDALSRRLQPSPVSPLCAIKSSAVRGHTRTPPNLKSTFHWRISW